MKAKTSLTNSAEVDWDMGKLQKLFESNGAKLFQNDSFCLDHYYQEPYQDSDEPQGTGGLRSSDTYETHPSAKFKNILECAELDTSLCSYFMDGSRKTYKVGDLVMPDRKVFPLIAAQLRAGCVFRDQSKSVHAAKVNGKSLMKEKNVLLISSAFNSTDFAVLKGKFEKRNEKKDYLRIDLENYNFEKVDDTTPQNAGIAKANYLMHKLEIEIIIELVKSKSLETDKMLVVDGPLEFIAHDDRSDGFADYFYNVIGISKSFDPNKPLQSTRSSPHIGALLLDMKMGERTQVFMIEKKTRRYGVWYLRIHPSSHLRNPLDGIVKIEKMAMRDDFDHGIETDVVDNISLSVLSERCPTCHGNDERWPNHIYPVYLAEKMLKSTFYSDIMYMNQFFRDDF